MVRNTRIIYKVYWTHLGVVAFRKVCSLFFFLSSPHGEIFFSVLCSHCASQWGNDFRPDYRKLGILRQQFPETPILALTATATATVCNDTVRILLIDGAETFKNSVDRPNLFYEVKPKPASPAALADDMATWIKRNYPAGDSGIVYCLTRKDTETLAEELRQRGIACAAYHADMDPQDRMAVHHAWADSSLQAITATVSFGMGVSKPNVRFVIHHSMSKSVENYYQESGRAGRDGLPAHCRLYYRFSDYLRQAAVVSMETRWEPHLRHMMAYATAGGCRRGVICRHFAEAPAPCRGMCDWCRWAPRGGGVVSRDATQAAASVLKVLQTWPGAEKRATLVQLIDKWRASEKGGAAKGVDKDEAERILEAMVAAGLVKLDFGFTAYSTNVYLKKARELGGGGRVELGAIPPRGADAEEAVKPEEGRTAVGGVGMPREGEYGGEVILGSRGQEVPSRELSEKGGQGGKDGRREEEGRARKKMKGEGGASRSGRRAIEAAVVVDLVDSDDEDFIAVKRA